MNNLNFVNGLLLVYCYVVLVNETDNLFCLHIARLDSDDHLEALLSFMAARTIIQHGL